MLTVNEAEARAGALIEAARKAGADAADVLYAGDASLGISVRLGELEDVGRSEGEEIGLRVFIGQRSATVSSSDMSRGALGELVERAVAMAREAPEDPHSGLAPENMLFRGDLLPLESDDGADPSPAELKERALATEAAARAVPGITNSEGAGASAGAACSRWRPALAFAAATHPATMAARPASSAARGRACSAIMRATPRATLPISTAPRPSGGWRASVP
jgi:PmbA protein